VTKVLQPLAANSVRVSALLHCLAGLNVWGGLAPEDDVMPCRQERTRNEEDYYQKRQLHVVSLPFYIRATFQLTSCPRGKLRGFVGTTHLMHLFCP
jgi:hypothetical protein